MNPTESNLIKHGCTPVSSNCVLWQGPDLVCIGVCNGDTVSEVTGRMAEAICLLQSQLDFTDLDLKCLFDVCNTCPEPDKTIKSIVMMLISKVCDLQTAVLTLTSGTGNAALASEISLILPTTLRYYDVNGDLVSTLPLSEYVQLVGSTAGTLKGQVASNAAQLATHAAQITSMQAQIQPPTPIPQISAPSVMPDSGLYDISSVVTATATQFGALRTATGTPTALTNSVAVQGTTLNSANQLSASGTMSGLTGWVSSPATVADSVTNAWLTIKDMRTAVAGLQTSTALTCSDVVVDFAVVLNSSGTQATIHFSGYCSIPSGFSDVNQAGSQLTITDALGNSYVTHVGIASAASSGTPATITLSSTPLNNSLDYTFTLKSELTNGTLTCTKYIVKAVPSTVQKCPVVNTTPSTSSIAYTLNPNVTTDVTYRLELWQGSSMISTVSYQDPSTLVSSSFTGLTTATAYVIKIYVDINGLPTITCSAVSVTTS